MPKQDCESCGGTGWIVAVEDGISAASRCSCVAATQSYDRKSTSQIPNNYRDASFDNFVVPSPRDNPTARRQLQEAMLPVKTYANNFPAFKDKIGLLLVGPQGVGKTHLAVAVLQMLIERGHEGIFFDYQNLLERIRGGYNEKMGGTDRETYRNALDAEVLLLDDLGAHRVTDWVEDTVTSLITHRCNYRKPLIATTNFPDPEMGGIATERMATGGTVKYLVHDTLEQRIGSRARSRLFEMCTIVQMWGLADYRQRPRRTNP